jgi:hypothetical protein
MLEQASSAAREHRTKKGHEWSMPRRMRRRGTGTSVAVMVATTQTVRKNTSGAQSSMRHREEKCAVALGPHP